MDQLYSTTLLTAIFNKQEKDTVDGPSVSSKLSALEQELRDETITAKASLVSEQSGNASKPTRQQADMIQKFAPSETSMNHYDTLLGDYTTIINQMKDSLSDVAPMFLSTLESKKEVTRMGNNLQQMSMINSQFGLNKFATKSVKEAKKNHKLQSQDTFL